MPNEALASICERTIRCLADAASYYEISFDTAPAKSVNEYHGLEVKLDKPNLTARTRNLYYAQP